MQRHPQPVAPPMHSLKSHDYLPTILSPNTPRKLYKTSKTRNIMAVSLFTAAFIFSVLNFTPQGLSFYSHSLYGELGSFSRPEIKKCPSLHGELGPSRMSPYTQIESIIPKFRIEVAHDELACNSFAVRISRLNNEECSAIEETVSGISNDSSVVELLRGKRGPDSFLIRTDGAERWASEWSEYEGDCSYRFDVKLRNAGPVAMEIFHMYENYAGLEENTPEYPPLIYKRMLSVPLQLDICDAACAPFLAPIHVTKQRLMYSASKSSPVSSKQMLSLPTCSGPNPIKGVYLPHNFVNIVRPQFRAAVGSISLMPMSTNYEFVPTGCKWTHDGLAFRNHSACTTKKQNSHIIGDSHGRVVADSTIRRLMGFDDIAYESVKEKAKDHTFSEGGSTVSFSWDPFGELLSGYTSCNKIQNFSSITVSIGSHLASKAWDTDRAVKHIRTLLSNLVRQVNECTPSGTPRIPLVFIGPPAQPPRTDGWISEWKDHRTNTRMKHWSDRMLEVALELGYAVIDQFALTQPFSEIPLGTDLAHYLATDALPAVVDELIGKTEMCGSN